MVAVEDMKPVAGRNRSRGALYDKKGHRFAEKILQALAGTGS